MINIKEKRSQEIEKLNNEKYLNKVLGEQRMKELKQVVGLEFSEKSLEKLKNISEEFLETEKQNWDEKHENLNQKQKKMRELRTEISENEDLRDKLIIVKSN
jgi:hypothetical protein